MSSKLVYISDNKQFARLEPEYSYYDDIRHCGQPCLYDTIEMSGLVSAHSIVVSPQSMVGNHSLCGLRSQQPRQKHHGGFMKNDTHHVQAQISSFCGGSLEYYRLLEVKVTICGVTTTCLLNSSSIHKFVDRRVFDNLELWEIMGETLEVVLADVSKLTIDNVCHVPIQLCRDAKQVVIYYVIDTLSISLILGMQWLTRNNPTIQWLDYKVDQQYGQSVVLLKGWAENR